MRSIKLHLAIMCMMPLAACVAPKQVQAPPPPIAAPVVAPPAPTTADWRDIPLTPGNWAYGLVGGGSVARFGRAGAAPEFVVRCDMGARTVSLARVAVAPIAATMAITTSAGNRALSAAPAGEPAAFVATLPARDPFLDKMAFSRGRFVVAIAGTARLIIPSWPEFARVIEDCRG